MNSDDAIDLQQSRRNIRINNDRLIAELAREKWWHLYARFAFGLVFAAALMFFLVRVL